MSYETGDGPQRDLEPPYLSECLLNMGGLESAIDDASGSLRAAIDLEDIVESFPDPGGETEAERLSDRAMQIREALDDVFPRTDGETWSLRITGTERESPLPEAKLSSSGIATALYKAAQNQAGAIAIEMSIESGEIATLLEDYSTRVSEEEAEAMPRRLRNMVGAVTETLDKVIPRNDQQNWSVVVDKQAQTLIDNQ